MLHKNRQVIIDFWNNLRYINEITFFDSRCCAFVLRFKSTKNDASKKYYDKANIAFAKQDYKLADSLFTLSINLLPHPDSYYNRAVCRRKLNDAKGYCLDLLSASNLGDNESEKLYWKQCAKADTVYKMKDGNIAAASSYDYVEYTTTYNYNNDFEYEKKDTAKNIVLAKERKNNILYYTPCIEVQAPYYKYGEVAFLNFVKDSFNIIQQIKKQNIATVIVFSLLSDENGNIKSIELEDGENNDFTLQVKNALFKISPLVPAYHNNRAVKLKNKIIVSCYDKQISFFGLFNNLVDTIKSNSTENSDVTNIEDSKRYISLDVNYPQRAKEEGIMGTCDLSFYVLPNGQITNIKILKGVSNCPECDQEAVRVLNSIPEFEQNETQNHKRAPLLMNISINFILK